MSKKQQKPHRIEFETNFTKALEAILYVLNKRSSVNLYNLLKVIFEADKYHLNKHGRPVTGDTYIKMPYGTVPSAVYDMIKQEPMPLAKLNLEQYPFSRKGKKGYFLKASRKPNLDFLSESDVEALEKGIAKYLDLPFSEVETKNHQEICWINAEMNQPIPFETIIENQEVLDSLKNSPLKLVV